MNIFVKRSIITIAALFLGSSAFSAEQPNVPVLYPKDNSVVGNKVNLVLDPSDMQFFQVTVNKTEYPVVDTSSGAHALQGLVLEQGQNIITVNVLVPSGEKDKAKMSIVASRSLKVFNPEGGFAAVPAGFSRDPFHTREREASCAGCHRLDVSSQDVNHGKPEEVLCFTCHRGIPEGRHSHGPAAVWNCLRCHNPDLYPAKYAFTAADPWKVSKSTQSVSPMAFTLSTKELFKPESAVLVSKQKAKDSLADFFNYLNQNPADKVRLEVHSDDSKLKTRKTKSGKTIGFKTNQALTSARGAALAALLKEAGIDKKKLIAVGMGDKLPKAPNKTPEGRDLNNRVEIVVYPSDLKVLNSQKLPVLKDRERVVVTVGYSQGSRIRKLRFIERVPKGAGYIKGSGFLKGKAMEPKMRGNELIWDFGDMDSNFTESLFYVVKKGKGAGTIPLVTKAQYASHDRELTREFDPKEPVQRASTVMEICLKCHSGAMNRKFKHGPVDGGRCNLCHNPHASGNAAWLRKPSWDLCTTCHAEQGSGVHVITAFVKGTSHPTTKRRDPSRRGKRLACASCHEPHSADTAYLLAFEAKTRSELCAHCHKK